MKTVLSFFLIFSITIATGTRLRCESCRNYTGDVCTKSTTETCAPSVTSCISDLTIMQIGETSYPQIIKSCATNPLMCHMTSKMSVGAELYNVAKCCQGNLCNKGSIQVPQIDKTENGLQCPACYKEGKSCTPKGNIKCQGPQTKCFTFSGRIYNGGPSAPISYQGCATQSACPVTAKSEKSGTGISCTKAVHHCSEEGDHSLPVIN